MDWSAKYGLKIPYSKAMWYYSLKLQRNYIFYMVGVLFLHYLPALIVDGVASCFGKSPR